ncbi:hypothetical protein [Escherichia coli]|uniref:hypothetical protein n=1 Tax=Escherichia coli TaxID=562 RepID=UPI002FBDE46B
MLEKRKKVVCCPCNTETDSEKLIVNYTEIQVYNQDIAWTAYYFLSLFKYFVKYFFPLDREDLLNLMDLAKDSPDAKQELLERLLSGKRMTGRDEMDIKRILKTKEALDNIRNFIDKQQLTNSDTPKKSTVPNEDKKGIR